MDQPKLRTCSKE